MDTVQALKERIRNIDGVPVECQRLIFAGQELQNSRLLADYKLRSTNSSLLPVASACGAGKVVQMLRENRTIDLQVVPLRLDQCNHERGDLDSFVEENAARVSYLRARQHHLFRDHHLLSAGKVQVPILEVVASTGGVSVTTRGYSPHKLSAMKCPGSPALSCASLATHAPSDDGSEAPSLPSSPCSSPCASPGLSLEIEVLKLAIPNTECCSLDAFTRENSEKTSRLLKRLNERRMADGF